MMRKAAIGGRWMRGLVGGLAAAVAFALAGCGEQDLYKPPRSPIQVVARVALPSISEDVAVLGDNAFVAGGQAGLHVVDLSNPAAPVVRGTIDTKKYAESVKVASTPTTGGVIDIAFVVEGTEGITTYNISNPDSAYSFQQGTTAVDGNGLFLELPQNPTDPYTVYLAENWHGIRLFESDAGVPGRLAYNGVFSSTRGFAKGIAVDGGFAYVADDEMGLAVLDVRVKVLGSVKLLSACDTAGNARGVDVKNGYAYIADGPNGLVVMSVHEGDTPVIVGHLPLPGLCRAIVVRDGRAYLAAQDGGVHVVGVSNPAQPELLGTVVTTYATGIALASSGLVVASDKVEGLVILGGQGPFADTTPPAAIEDLTAAATDSASVRLAWHAPGNDLYSGTASQYDIRYARQPITSETWGQATTVDGEPAPARSGTAESFRVPGLTAGTEYFFAIRTADFSSNWSGISNAAAATTFSGNVPPSLTGGSVSPEGGTPAEPFTFRVTYTDGDGDAPAVSDVIVGGARHAMVLASGDYRDGAVFVYEAALPKGSYTYSFAFDDGEGHPVASEPVAGPWVGELFVMGSPAGETGRDADETQHTVVFTRNVQFSDHEVTQAEYQDLIGGNPSRHPGPEHPVENVTWSDAIAYCNARSTRDGFVAAYTISGENVTWNPEANGWRLPTEAEWERACRSGSSTALANGDLTWPGCTDTLGLPDVMLDSVGWYCGNAGAGPHDVKTKAPNAAGLHDMHGNVWEWCWDWYGDLGSGIAGDPAGPEAGLRRVVRGGSWYYLARNCRSAARAAYWPTSKDDVIGFRVVRTAP